MNALYLRRIAHREKNKRSLEVSILDTLSKLPGNSYRYFRRNEKSAHLRHVKVIGLLTYVFRFKAEFEDPLAIPDRETLQTFCWWLCPQIKGKVDQSVPPQVLIEDVRLFSWVVKHLYNFEIPETALTYVRQVRCLSQIIQGILIFAVHQQ
jgi:hypothetical protein